MDCFFILTISGREDRRQDLAANWESGGSKAESVN